MAWRHNARDFEPPSPSPPLTLPPRHIQAASGTTGHSGRKNGQGPLSPGDFVGPHAETLCPTLPLANALTLDRCSAHRTASRSRLPVSWVLTLTLGMSPRGTSQGAWRRNAGDWGPPSTGAGLTLPPRRLLGR